MKRSYPFRATGGEMRDLEQPGYYPGYSTLAQKNAWDYATRHAVAERVRRLSAAALLHGTRGHGSRCCCGQSRSAG